MVSFDVMGVWIECSPVLFMSLYALCCERNNKAVQMLMLDFFGRCQKEKRPAGSSPPCDVIDDCQQVPTLSPLFLTSELV